jgi:hypothetical protein
MRATEDALTRLEAAANEGELRREQRGQEIRALTERGWIISREAKATHRPAFQAAVKEAAPILDVLLESPEWERLRVAWGKLRGVPTPEELPLPTLYLKGGPNRRRAVFKGEVWSVSPYASGIFHWTVGRRLTLTRKIHFMQPPQALFQSESGLLELIPWYENQRFDDLTAQVAMRFCELVSEGRLIDLLAQMPPTGKGGWFRLLRMWG